ncbi:MAG: HD domain-containing protein [Clostridia bacterium]|nr:HD domain-containing protein [Clostridia bacterium]
MIIDIPSQVNKALEILSAAGFEAYVVGGAVRDALMGRPVNDWDITTSALPQETEKLFEDYRVIETGIKHGTVTVIIDGEHIEITTFRIDGDYSDNRRPDSVEFTCDVTLDLSRRDFTCNAIAYSPLKGFVDPFGGIEDINNKIVRCVGEADRRFNEDGLRILRALRFSLTLGFTLDSETSSAIHRNRGLLANISSERIVSELCKMLPFTDAEFLDEYSDIIFEIIPELKAEKGCAQNHERHIYDVWYHSCKAAEYSPPDAEIRLAMLLHDIGKPSCKSTDENGVDHFYSHAHAGAGITRGIMNRLKVSNRMKNRIIALVEYHGFMPEQFSDKTMRKYIGTLGTEIMEDLFAVREADIRAQNPAFAEEALGQNEAGRKRYEEIISRENCFGIKDLAINGADLIAMGIPEGTALGRILNTLFDDVISDRVLNEKTALAERAKELYNDGNS